MRFIFLLIIPFLSFPQQDRLDQYFSSKNYSMYISSFEDNFSLNQIDDLDSEVVSKYIISLLKSNFNSFGILPSRKLDNIKNKVESFILKNNSRTRDELLYEYGKSEFNLNRFKSSVIYLEKIKNKDDEINFLLGVGEFNNKNFEKSKLFLEQVSSYIYEDKKNLFLGIISYQAEEFDLALNYFDNISDKDLEKKYLQYIISINYLREDYEATVKLSDRINNNRTLVDNIDYCLFFIGKALFILEDFNNSIITLNKIKNSIDREDEISFLIAYSNYILKNYNESKPIFKSLSDNSSDYSQLSSFYLGMIFLEEREFNLSKNYFYASYKNDKDEIYTKSSLLNYAKSLYELGDYDQSIAVLNKLKSTFPDFEVKQVNELVSENYFMTNNYSRIISYLKSKDKITDEDKKKFQYVTYQKGVNEFNRGNFKNSIQYFDLSQRYNSDNDIFIKSHLNKSEAFFIGNMYKKASDEILKVINKKIDKKLKLELLKLLGYSLFNQNEYVESSKYLSNYFSLKDNDIQNDDIDLLLRLADSYYGSKNFKNAIETYNKSLKSNDTNKNYINYQIGLSYYGLDDFTNSMLFMDRVISNPDKSLDDDAIFRKAQIYFENSEFDKSINNYTKLIENFKFSQYLPYSYINRATSYFNLKAYEQAEDDYLYVLKNLKDENIQSQAILGMQKTVSFTNSFSQLNLLISEYKNRFPENDNILKIQFDNIRNLYFNQKYDDLVLYVKDITAKDQDIYNEYETNYYLAESLFKLNEYNSAKEAYFVLADSINSKYYTRSVNRLAQLYFKENNYEESLKYYKDLELISKNNREKIDSYVGSLTNYYFLKKFDSVQYYSQQINNFDKISFNNRNKINLLSAKSYIESGNTSTGIDKLLTTINLVKDESAAEANYLLAKIFFDQGQKNQALESLYSLNENFSNYQFWVGKSYILIAEIFISMGENFQANATLESLIENTDIILIKNEAEELINKLNTDD
tara:strand:+ start:16669 stop:19602 length:2934 start_codon:yes stop_codon:yes gene_type:complete